MKWIVFVFFCLVCCFSCQKKDIMSYDTEQCFIDFGTPIIQGRTMQGSLDSLYFSFGMLPDNVEEVKIALPIRLIGQVSPKDRSFQVRIHAVKGSIDPNLVDFSEPLIRAGRLDDTLLVSVKRDADMHDNIGVLVLDLIENSSFKLGRDGYTSCRFFMTERLLEPNWWKTWEDFFGPFYQEVYKKWMELYVPGVDPTPTFYVLDKPNFYWDNMPGVTNKLFYPVTFMYIDLLKSYFEQHEVYPDGDRTIPRITLP